MLTLSYPVEFTILFNFCLKLTDIKYFLNILFLRTAPSHAPPASITAVSPLFLAAIRPHSCAIESHLQPDTDIRTGGITSVEKTNLTTSVRSLDALCTIYTD